MRCFSSALLSSVLDANDRRCDRRSANSLRGKNAPVSNAESSVRSRVRVKEPLGTVEGGRDAALRTECDTEFQEFSEVAGIGDRARNKIYARHG